MSRISDRIRECYNKNTYSSTRTDEMYQQDTEFFDMAFERMVDNHVQKFGVVSDFNPSILDLCCGCGLPYSKFMSNYGRIVGCDVSDNQVRLASINIPNGRFVRKNILDLRLRHKYDMITMYHAFYNIPTYDKVPTLKKIEYWLQEHGTVVLTTYGEETWVKNKDDFFGQPMIYFYSSPEDFLQMLSMTSLTVIEHDTREDKLGSKLVHLWMLEKRR